MSHKSRWGKALNGAGSDAADPDPALLPGPITSVREMRRRVGRYVVEVAGVGISPVSVEMIAEFQLTVACTLDGPTLDNVLAASRSVACYDRALETLARRSRSTRDLERWLADRGFSSAEIGPALGRLTTLGVLDDLAFARGFAQTRMVGRGFGWRRVAAELGRHGVASGIVATVLSELSERRGGGEEEALLAAAERRAKALQKLAPDVARRRLVGWLVRRGFAPGEAGAAVRRLFPGRQ